MSVVLVATLTPAPEHRDVVREAFLKAIPEVHGEPGCELYALHESGDDLVMVEKWASQEALDTHMKAPAFVALSEVLGTKLAGAPNFQMLTAVPVGDASKGAV